MTETFFITGDEAADRLLGEEPLALILGMLLDQQIPLEKAFRSPYDLKERLGGKLDSKRIASMDEEELSEIFRRPPALHRFPAANAKRVQELCRIVVEQYGGRADRVWKDASDGTDLLRRVKALPGFGDQKAKIFVALLGKQLGVQPPGWREAAGDYGVEGSFKSVADITDAATLRRVREYKKDMKAKAKAKAAAAATAG